MEKLAIHRANPIKPCYIPRKSEKARLSKMSRNGTIVMARAKHKQTKQPTSFSLRKQARGFYRYQAFLGKRNVKSLMMTIFKHAVDDTYGKRKGQTQQ